MSRSTQLIAEALTAQARVLPRKQGAVFHLNSAAAPSAAAAAVETLVTTGREMMRRGRMRAMCADIRSWKLP